MAYNNSRVIKLLQQRGDLIRTEKWDKVANKNAQILKEIQNEATLDHLQTPVSVFATFNSEEGF